MQTQEWIPFYQNLINESLSKLISSTKGPHALLFEAASYSLNLPAKRLRPLLVLAVLQDFDQDIKQGIEAACALEMVHTYSLIHDDLPCMDDDDMRRGKPALHKVYGEALAVLGGDFLLTRAFEILASISLLSCTTKIKLIKILSKQSGGDGMIGGQVMDLSYEGHAMDLSFLNLMYQKKTASLLSVAIEFGVLIASLKAEDRKYLQNAAIQLGIGYQYMDDFLEMSGDTTTLGKPTGSDLGHQKTYCLTLPSAEKIKENATKCFKNALGELALVSRPTPFIKAIFEKCFKRIH